MGQALTGTTSIRGWAWVEEACAREGLQVRTSRKQMPSVLRKNRGKIGVTAAIPRLDRNEPQILFYYWGSLHQYK